MNTLLWSYIESVKQVSPLVHNITNFVVMNNTANALLAAGASPIMAHCHSEVVDMVNIAHVLVINIGTLDEYWVSSMMQAAQKANELGRPWVLDPVGAGATPYRNKVLRELLALNPTIIRGNASEIMALMQTHNATKGVDSTHESLEAQDYAVQLAAAQECVVCVSGATDIITDGKDVVHLRNGHPMMTRITGMGCSATALVGAFTGVIADPLHATVAAMALLGVVGQLVQPTAAGPGSLQTAILDKLHNITEAEFNQTLDLAVL